MLEPQSYPEVRACPTCPVRAPYDTVAFSYPYAMGVEADVVASEFTAEMVLVGDFPPEGGAVEGTTRQGAYLLSYTENAALKAVSGLLEAGVDLGWAEAGFDAAGGNWPAGTFVISSAPDIDAKLEALASEFGLRFVATESHHGCGRTSPPAPGRHLSTLRRRPKRIRLCSAAVSGVRDTVRVHPGSGHPDRQSPRPI